MRIVITIGGSIIISEFTHEMFRSYADVLNSLRDEHELFIVVGGGKPARDYIRVARELGASEALCDDIGIDVTRLNARMLITALGESAYPSVPENFREALRYSTSGRIVVMGGTEPAHSTDAVGAILAETVGADLMINLTSVDGFYDRDPEKHPDARFYPEITASEMLEHLIGCDVKAGTYEFFDHTAIQMIKRSGVKTLIVNGRDPENLLRALDGDIGTAVIPE
ncbi:UMP kinase [Methanothermobacter wolfeii]|uniref:Uridylate kinase n=1 Tax=Methanothermobacter wolfeii TaxID=145261 RepID=A0A9E7UMP4_METWO|nr:MULTISPECIES: UMP kinase [Methanothermobacter]MDI6702298.1 UMP kinase [Methanothermobacter wolfeii]MDI6842308.1 UMP kinase [Methanothermobacter wolfeii]NLM03178.1 UMP kinase [Methanothermobacter wolfeii]QHN06622.1 UMP kinase [Methanothermobacter sp. THM-1]UXH31177.1 UMP kinase [Methanothermobacter wolfeii]